MYLGPSSIQSQLADETSVEPDKNPLLHCHSNTFFGQTTYKQYCRIAAGLTNLQPQRNLTNRDHRQRYKLCCCHGRGDDPYRETNRHHIHLRTYLRPHWLELYQECLAIFWLLESLDLLPNYIRTICTLSRQHTYL